MGSGGRGNEPGGCGGRVGGCSRRTSQQYSWNVYTSLPPPVGKLCRDGGLRKRAPWNARSAFHLMWLSSCLCTRCRGRYPERLLGVHCQNRASDSYWVVHLYLFLILRGTYFHRACEDWFLLGSSKCKDWFICQLDHLYFSSKTWKADCWIAAAPLSPPLLLFQQMELCLTLLRSLFHGCCQLLSVVRCLPLSASTENKWAELVGHNKIQYFLVESGRTVLSRTWAIFLALLLLVQLLFCVDRKSDISVMKRTKTRFEQGLPVALETRFFKKHTVLFCNSQYLAAKPTSLYTFL